MRIATIQTKLPKLTGNKEVDENLKGFQTYVLDINNIVKKLIKIGVPEQATAFYALHLLDQQRSRKILRAFQTYTSSASPYPPEFKNTIATLAYEAQIAMDSWSNLGNSVDPLSRDLTLMLVHLLGYRV